MKKHEWIVSEDVNVEHLLDVFTSIDTNADNVWNACAYFMEHLFWHKATAGCAGAKARRAPR
jgi:hypothetical protein